MIVQEADRMKCKEIENMRKIFKLKKKFVKNKSDIYIYTYHY